ncbi:unnamed protein product [Durusdinium trenchii]|uniref:Uncharacterized protein n=1 Tax=Durusdinium trenchii TaxID=1381693 RepID=A0ABP0SN84_9DINO
MWFRFATAPGNFARLAQIWARHIDLGASVGRGSPGSSGLIFCIPQVAQCAALDRSCDRLRRGAMPGLALKGGRSDASEEGDRFSRASRGSTATAAVTMKSTFEDEGFSPDAKEVAPLEAAHFEELLQFLEKRLEGRSVQCCDAELGPAEAPALAEALQSASLEALILASNELGPEGMDALAPALASCHHLRHLDLSWNQIGPSGAFSLAAQLPKMHLTQLELSSNQLEASGAKAFAVALAEDPHLLTLDLSWNSMGDEGGLAMAEMLSTNRTLRHLNLAINDLRWPSAAALRQAVQGHPSLQELDLAGNDIPEDQLPRPV